MQLDYNNQPEAVKQCAKKLFTILTTKKVEPTQCGCELKVKLPSSSSKKSLLNDFLCCFQVRYALQKPHDAMHKL